MPKSPEQYKPSSEEITKVEEEIKSKELQERKEIEEAVEKTISDRKEQEFEYGRKRYLSISDRYEFYKRASLDPEKYSNQKLIEQYNTYPESEKTPSNQIEFLKNRLTELEKESLNLPSFTLEDFEKIQKEKPKKLTTDEKGRPIYYSWEVACHGKDKTYTWPDLPSDLGRKLFIFTELGDMRLRDRREASEATKEYIEDLLSGFSREALEKGDLETAIDGYVILKKLRDPEINSLIKEKLEKLRNSENVEDKKKFLAINKKISDFKESE